MFKIASLSCLSLLSALLFATPALACPGHAQAAEAAEAKGSCCAGKAAAAAEARPACCAGKAEAKGSCCAGKAEGACKGGEACAGCEACAAKKAAAGEKAGKASCHGEAGPVKAEVKKVDVSTLAALLGQKTVTAVDVNGARTRDKEGILPGALLLTSSTEYDLGELPAAKDARLVFYCANAKCSASTRAAEKAVAAGYSDVSILPEGIMGWKKAGQKAARVPRS